MSLLGEILAGLALFGLVVVGLMLADRWRRL